MRFLRVDVEERAEDQEMNGIEPETAFEGYIKAQIETLNREMIEAKKTLNEIRDSWIFARGKVAGYAAAFGAIGGMLILVARALWK